MNGYFLFLQALWVRALQLSFPHTCSWSPRYDVAVVLCCLRVSGQHCVVSSFKAEIGPDLLEEHRKCFLDGPEV